MAPSAPAFQRRFIGQSTGNKSIVIGANWRWLRRWIQSSFDPSLLFGVVEPELTSGASIFFFFYFIFFYFIFSFECLTLTRLLVGFQLFSLEVDLKFDLKWIVQFGLFAI